MWQIMLKLSLSLDVSFPLCSESMAANDSQTGEDEDVAFGPGPVISPSQSEETVTLPRSAHVSTKSSSVERGTVQGHSEMLLNQVRVLCHTN